MLVVVSGRRRGVGCVLLDMAGAFVGRVSEVEWVEKYWLPLSAEQFAVVKEKISLEPWRHGRRWRTWARRSRFDSSRWTLIDDDEGGSTPLYIPTLPNLTAFGSRFARNEWARNDPREMAKSDNADAYAAYCKVRSVLSEDEWERLRRVDRASFSACELGYVEVGAVLCACIDEPCGTVDPEVRMEVEKELGQGTSRRIRRWLAGCLLQYAGVSVTDLAEFCARVLKFNPYTSKTSIRDHRRRGLRDKEAQVQAALCSRELECLRSGPVRFSEYALRLESSDETRLKVWKRRLADLPTVSAAAYGSLHQADLDEMLRRITPSTSPIEQERVWVRRYWELLTPEEHARLNAFVEPVPHRRRACWIRDAPRAGLDDTTPVGTDAAGTSLETASWTMMTDLRKPGSDRPLYIPELGAMKPIARSVGYFPNDYQAYYALHHLLGRDNWAKLRTIKPLHFKSCKEGYLRLAAEFHRCFFAPFGIVGAPLTCSIAQIADLPFQSPSLLDWVSGCFLQYCDMPFDDLVSFCYTHLRMTLLDPPQNLSPQSSSSESVQRSLADRLKATAEALSCLQVLSLDDLKRVTTFGKLKRPHKGGNKSADMRKRRHVDCTNYSWNHADGGSNLGNSPPARSEYPPHADHSEYPPHADHTKHADDSAYAPHADHPGCAPHADHSGYAREPWLLEPQVPTGWRQWLHTPQVQELADSPLVRYVWHNYWPQLSLCMAMIENEE
ncbi:hypothetical protein GNI_046290 [Gregarina niphandrodes]|uniref:Uncharacterized protein n=1 Tax=Gregarina niphandrodes TaxID=110365 RepID=A0A023B9U8_GRENI|nr:hypothetical protein GNI_046290 [Gregarina niphandrodes]EZG75549.1 hypothetical protein GNI_046290 [Gregarina niphandrodes]|eukprot:XP_011129608.1 hypothetical protein GNI_046290 [Gregarina niphandrodes]